MAPAAFFFSISALEKRSSGPYNLPALNGLFSSLLELDSDERVAFELRQGDLLLHNLCYSPSKVEFEARKMGTRVGGVATTSAGDTDLFKTLIWDFLDAAGGMSATIEPNRFYQAVGYRDAFALSVSALDPGIRDAVDSALDPTYYLGYCVVDPGNPIQRYTFIDSLVHSFDYRRRWLLFDPWRSEDPFDPPPLDRHDDEWYVNLGFDGIRYLEDAERNNPDFVPAWPAPPTSERGAKSEAILEQRRGKGHLARLAENAASMQIDEDTLPFAIEVDAMPRASDAILEEKKLILYALNPEHDQGRHKARWFKGALGIEASDWRHLSAQIRQGLVDAEKIRQLRSTPWGIRYSVDTSVRGLNTTTAPVTSVWEVAADEPPRLITVYPGKSSELRPDAPPALTLPSSLPAEERWPALWEIACGYAADAAAGIVPTPMNFAGEWLPEGAFGFTLVAVRDARRGFARWLVKYGHAKTQRGHGAVLVVPPDTIDRSRAYGDAFVEVMHFNGIESSVSSHLN